MPVKPNGTHAKEVAIHFLNLTTDGRYTPSVVARTVNQVKNLFNAGYTKEECIKCLDYCIHVKKINMYSIGYLSAAIADLLKEIKKHEAELEQTKIKQKIQDMASNREVNDIDESTKRNREKAGRNHIQSRFGTKFDFHLLEK